MQGMKRFAFSEKKKSGPIFEKPFRLMLHTIAVLYHVSCYAHTKPGLLQTAQDVNDLKAQ